jgi:hypothetical protein
MKKQNWCRLGIYLRSIDNVPLARVHIPIELKFIITRTALIYTMYRTEAEQRRKEETLMTTDEMMSLF